MRADIRKSVPILAAIMMHMVANITTCAAMAFATTRITSRIMDGCPPYIAIPMCAFVIIAFLAAMVPMSAAMVVTVHSTTEAMDGMRRSRKNA